MIGVVDGAPPRAEPPPRIDPASVRLTKESETLFIPLYAKALDYRSPRPVLHDAKADEIVRSVPYDFSRVAHPGLAYLLAARSKLLDEWAREFLEVNPTAVVLNLGCGLDARILRVAPVPSVGWYDVDLPEVIELRRRFFADRPGYAMTAASITSAGWLGSLPRDRPLLMVADGVLEYLPGPEVAALLRRLLDRFPRGRLIFDVLNGYALRRGNQGLAATGARLRWAVDDPRNVDRIDPRLRRTASLKLASSHRVPRSIRIALFLVGLFSPGRAGAFRLLSYEF